MSTFSVSYDTTTKIVSAGIVIVLAAAGMATHSILVGGIALVILFLGYAYSPRGYQVSDGAIVVKRLIGDVRIPLAGLRDVRSATRDDLSGAIRLFGSGGLFGYYGLFRTANLGKSSWYVTNRSKAVIVITSNKTVVLSPDDVDGFINTVRQYAANFGGDAGRACATS